ncbi:type IV pilus twitching motility protein PilT [Rhodoluna limnophila]|uniref:type IV pilus twitching motility protein PilT n=1 Tax=Rhodoluna limnophila TaxID=232537 RepID=UPI00110643FE|nr:type IV pilus twitching motility protein PilT [Rhodoluna limnophila]
MSNLHRTSAPELAILSVLESLPNLRASDLHVICDAVPKIRVDGALMNLPGAGVWSKADVEAYLMSLLNEEQRNRFEADLELDFSFKLNNAIRFRINLYLQQNCMGAAIRVIPEKILSLEALGVPEVLASFTELPRGLVLVTGPTGSGKSTTLAAMIDRINHSRAVHIMTVEDPIEFVHSSDKAMVNQREVGSDTHSFADALRHVLRQDPDVILIGELRDYETISAALTAAETGHLVFATLHTQDAAQTINRIVDVFPADQQAQIRIQLALTLRGIVSQVLVPHISGKGRVAASEILVVNPAIANMIRENKAFQIPTTMMAGKDEGMQGLDQDLANRVQSRLISLQAAYDVAHDREALMKLIGRGHGFLAVEADSKMNPHGKKPR